MDRGVPIRSISRCITVLQAINRHGALSLMEVARKAKLPYPTACRIVQTLIQEGLIECEATRKCYRPTGLVHALSRGFHNRDRLVTTARPFMVALTRKVGWPLLVSTRVGHSMMVRDTTDDLTALTTEHFPPGHTMPLVDSPAGRLFLACLEGENDGMAGDAVRNAEDEALMQAACDATTRARIRADGYLVSEVEPRWTHPEGTSSINVPLREDGRVTGVLSLLYFSATVDARHAVDRYLGDLVATAAAITAAVGAPSAAAPKSRPILKRTAGMPALSIASSRR